MKKILLTLSMICAASAFAQDAPKVAEKKEPEVRHIDFTQVLVGIDGKPIGNPGDSNKPGVKATPMTLNQVSITALEMTLDEDKGSSGEAHVKLDILAKKIFERRDCILTNNEITRIEDRIGKVPWINNAIPGAAWRVLDPARVKKLEAQEDTE
jgi:hypothetical protein